MSREEALTLLSNATPLARKLISSNGKHLLSEEDLNVLQKVRQVYKARLLTEALIEEAKLSWEEVAILLGTLAVHHSFLLLIAY